MVAAPPKEIPAIAAHTVASPALVATSTVQTNPHVIRARPRLCSQKSNAYTRAGEASPVTAVAR